MKSGKSFDITASELYNISIKCVYMPKSGSVRYFFMPTDKPNTIPGAKKCKSYSKRQKKYFI